VRLGAWRFVTVGSLKAFGLVLSCIRCAMQKCFEKASAMRRASGGSDVSDVLICFLHREASNTTGGTRKIDPFVSAYISDGMGRVDLSIRV